MKIKLILVLVVLLLINVNFVLSLSKTNHLLDRIDPSDLKEGKTITLFGQRFIVANVTIGTGELVLLKGTEEIHLNLFEEMMTIDEINFFALSGKVAKPPVTGYPEESLNCRRTLGCWDEIGCHPVGYVRDYTYCYEKNDTYAKIQFGEFIYQFLAGASCNNSYECVSNICLNNICIDREEEINRQVDAKFDELKAGIVAKAEEELDKLNESGLPVETEYGEVNIKKSSFEKIVDWIKNIFS